MVITSICVPRQLLVLGKGDCFVISAKFCKREFVLYLLWSLPRLVRCHHPPPAPEGSEGDGQRKRTRREK